YNSLPFLSYGAERHGDPVYGTACALEASALFTSFKGDRHGLRRLRTVPRVQVHRLRRGLPGGLLLPGRGATLHRSDGVPRLRSLRAGMPGGSDLSRPVDAGAMGALRAAQCGARGGIKANGRAHQRAAGTVAWGGMQRKAIRIPRPITPGAPDLRKGHQET